jgi:streptomycin 6-kinase
MQETPLIPPDLMSTIPVSKPVFVTETAIANIWKVQIDENQFAALKIYKKPDMGNERCGFHYLKALNGVGAAKVFWFNQNAALTEWLKGPSLGDLTRDGQDELASNELVAVANKLHASPSAMATNFPHLDHWFSALFQLKFASDCPSTAQRDLLKCKQLASDLVHAQQDIRPLHGDLHHDNIQLGTRGYCAFDAKGVVGERTFELANAFRNPKGAEQIIRDPARILYLADLWSHSFDVDQHRLLQWASVKCALSMAWRSGPVFSNDPEMDLLSLLLSFLEP